MRGAFENLFAFLLRNAAEHSKLFPLFLQLLEIRQPMKDFLFGFVTDGAGVVQNQISLLDSLHLSIAFLHERADDLFRVMHIHLAAEGFQIKGFLWIPRHIGQYRGLPGQVSKATLRRGRDPSAPRCDPLPYPAKAKRPTACSEWGVQYTTSTITSLASTPVAPSLP